MDIRLNKNITEVIINDKVVKSVESDKDKFGEHMKELIGDNTELLEALRFCAKKMKVNHYTFKNIRK